MTRIGIPEQPPWQYLTPEERADFDMALKAVCAALPESSAVPLEEFYALVQKATGRSGRWPEFALNHLRARHEALYTYGVGVSRP
jgi:hypothetical protein